MRSKQHGVEPQNPTFTEAARRKQIIEQAIKTIAEEGYAQTTLARIARRVGISKSVISYYFQSKEKLLWEVIVEVYSHIAQFMWSKMQNQANARKMLQAYIKSNIIYVREYPTYAMALVEILRNTEGKLSPDQPTEDPGIAPLEGLLRTGQQTGYFREFSPRPMAISIRKAIDGALNEWQHHPDLDLEHYIHELLELFDLATRKTEA